MRRAYRPQGLKVRGVSTVRSAGREPDDCTVSPGSIASPARSGGKPLNAIAVALPPRESVESAHDGELSIRFESVAEAPDSVSGDPGPPEQAESGWVSWRVHRALEELSQRERTLIVVVAVVAVVYAVAVG